MITKSYKLSVWHRATGVLKYSPRRHGNWSDQNWWIMINVPDEIGTYYRRLFHNNYKTIKLQRPFWGPHITISRNEEPKNKNVWGKYAGQKIEFEYGGSMATNDSPLRWKSFYWLEAKCPQALDIREELGLPRNPYPDFHLTIGNTEDCERRWYEQP